MHGDIKPDNVCMKPRAVMPQQTYKRNNVGSWPRYQSEYEFSLIDFGIISKFKVKKASKTYSSHVGNLMFSSLRGLKC